MMKLTTNAEKNSVRLVLADSFSNADCSNVSQHSGKPHVVRRLSVCLNNKFSVLGAAYSVVFY